MTYAKPTPEALAAHRRARALRDAASVREFLGARASAQATPTATPTAAAVLPTVLALLAGAAPTPGPSVAPGEPLPPPPDDPHDLAEWIAERARRASANDPQPIDLTPAEVDFLAEIIRKGRTGRAREAVPQ